VARYWCQRCKQESNTLDEPHLCKDVKKRYDRNRKAVETVVGILNRSYGESEYNTDIAADIIKALSGRDLGVD